MKTNIIKYSLTCSINGLENTVTGEIGETFFTNMKDTVYTKEDLLKLAQEGMEDTIGYVIYNIETHKDFEL
jgi:hypothetical protein